jgi:hypothetical protein
MSTFVDEDPQLKQNITNQQQQQEQQQQQDDNSNPIQTYLNTLGKEHIELARKKVLGHTSFTINLRKPGILLEKIFG